MTDPAAFERAVREAAETAYDKGVLHKHGFGFKDLPEVCGKAVGADVQNELANRADTIIRAFLAAAEREGWVMAPKEATADQRDAMRRLNHPRDHELYACAVAARPAFPPQEETDERD